MSDILGFHPYYFWNRDPDRARVASPAGFESYLDECVAFARDAGKDLIASETVWGHATTGSTWR
jgi:hypothetical protein